MLPQYIRRFLVLSILLALDLGVLCYHDVVLADSSSPPTVGAPSVRPSSILVNQTTLITVTSQITTSPSNPVVSARLLRLDARGNVVASLGSMYDDGTHGDAIAGNGVFTMQGYDREPAPVVIRLQVVATFLNNPAPVYSGITEVAVVSNRPPVANAGPAQTVVVGTQVQLDGSQSSDVDGDPLTFYWSLLTVPTGSTTTLSDATAVHPTLTIDRPGTYVVQLIVNDGKVDSTPATVSISTTNSPPVANAGPVQTVAVGATVHLDGSQSSDVDGDPLTYCWSFTALPAGSVATLSNPTAVAPTFIVDRPGTYVAQLIVNDGRLDSAPATVTISTTNSPPIANAGPAQTAAVGATVHLDGSQSSDVDGDPLTYRWAFTALPAGSMATLSTPTAVAPTFVVDRPGTYVVQLIVNDGRIDSVPTTVTISTCGPAMAPGLYHQSLIVNGVMRTFYVRIPGNYNACATQRVLFGWHGATGSGAEIDSRGVWYKYADLDGKPAIGITADGLPQQYLNGQTGWDLLINGADLALYDALYRYVTTTWNVDTSRLLHYGFSDGAIWLNVLATQRTAQVRAVAAIAGLLWTGFNYPSPPPDPTPSTPLPYFGKGCDDDTGIPIAYQIALKEIYRRNNGCGTDYTPNWNGDRYCVHYNGCISSFDVVWCERPTGGHTWQAPQDSLDIAVFFELFG